MFDVFQSWVRIPESNDPQHSVSVITPVCYSHHMTVWVTVLCVSKLILLAYGAYVSWTIRSISIPSMNDSGTITLAITGTAILGSTIIALATITEPWSYASDVCIVLGVWLCTTLILILVFTPKVIY